MNPKRQFRQLRNDDRWINLPQTTSHTPTRTHRITETRPRASVATTVVALVIAIVVAISLWAGLSGLHHVEPAALSPLPSTTLQPRPRVTTPCTTPEQLAPIGCSTYTAIAAAGVPGGTDAWSGALPPSLTLRVLNGKVTALISSGCNGITLPITLSATTITPSGPATSAAELCGGARGTQERWVSALFHDTVNYTLNGPELHLTAGSRVLDFIATATVPSPTPTASSTPVTSTPQCDLRILTPKVTSSGSSTGNWVELVTINNFGKTCDLRAADIRVGSRSSHDGTQSFFTLSSGKTTTLAVQAPIFCASGQRNIPSITKRAPLTIWRGPLHNAFGTFPELHCANPSINKI